MKKRSVIISILLASSFLCTAQGQVFGITKVLLAKTPLTSALIARDMLRQINTTFDNSGLGEDVFVTAHSTAGLPTVFDVSCTSTVAETFLKCARSALASKRDSYNADIVLILVPFLNSASAADVCGSVMKGTLNLAVIHRSNDIFAHAAVETVCFAVELNGEKIASHEVGHLFSIEHVSDTLKHLPVGAEANHAAVDLAKATVTASVLDCAGFSCDYQDVFSKAGRTFSGGGSAGNSSYSDAQGIIEDQSWDVVSNYRPLPPPEPCRLAYEFTACNGQSALGQITATLGGYTVTSASYDGLLSNGVWADVFDGALSCVGISPNNLSRARAILTTAYGISQCEINIPNQSCGGPGGGRSGN